MTRAVQRALLALALSGWALTAHAALPDPHRTLNEYATELGTNDVCKALGTDNTSAIEAWMAASIAWKRSRSSEGDAAEAEVLAAHDQRRYAPEVRAQARQAFAAQDEAQQRRVCAARKATLDTQRELLEGLTGLVRDGQGGSVIPWQQRAPLRGDNVAP